jgi:serine/threonine protein kinase
VEFLLRANADANLILQQAPDSLCETLVIDIDEDQEFDAKPEFSNDSWSPDQQIGDFRLVRMIGEGGMGTVWEAEQSDPMRRTVALKVIKQGMDSAEMITRFDSERQALAMMNHPNVARILKAGTSDTDRPYVAMEFVKGIPVNQYCNEQKLTIDERVALMIPVCQAIQHAHQNGILHSDIKPSNILVTTCEGRPVPKVIDFGLARTIGQPATDETPMKDSGRIIGTLEYMSPEQADLKGCDVDPRSDVYSLGIVLYELLAGSTPLTRQRTQQSAVMELLRIIREEEPPTLSAQVTPDCHQISEISQQQRLEATGLTGNIPPELERIVMQAVRKSPEQRHASPQELAKELQRYLSNDSADVRIGSKMFWHRTFRSRRQKSVAATLMITAMMVVATAVRFCQSQLARVAERAAHEGEFLA